MATTSRIGALPNNDNTGRQITYDYQPLTTVSGAPASFALLTSQAETTVTIALTGALSLTVGVGTSTTLPYVGDKLRFILTPDSSSRTVTFSTGFAVTASTIVCTGSKFAVIDFVFNGTTWVEIARAITV